MFLCDYVLSVGVFIEFNGNYQYFKDSGRRVRRTDVERRPTAVRRRSAVVLRIISGAEKKKHLMEAAPFGRLDQMLRTPV